MRYRLIILIALLTVIATLSFFLFYKNNKNSKELILYGNVDVRQVDIGFRVPGIITTMPFEEGDLVKAGSLMTTLDEKPYSDRVLEAKARVESIEKQLINAEEILKRREMLIDQGGVSEEDLENARTSKDVLIADLKLAKAELNVAQDNLDYTKAYAPIEGTILTRILEPGTVVREADPVYTLSVLSPVWVRAYVNEPNLGDIYPNMEAEVYTDTKKIGPYKGHIGFISPVAEFTPKTVETTKLRTDLVYRIRVVVDNPDKFLKQGMPVTVKLINNKKGFDERASSNKEPK